MNSNQITINDKNYSITSNRDSSHHVINKSFSSIPHKKLINILNADLTNKSKGIINSPRTIKACLHLGVIIEELYKPTFEEFKLQNPDINHLSQEIMKFHYDGREKIRIKTIKLL